MSTYPKKEDNTKMTGEEIVISGIAGNFPSAANTKILIDNLYNKVDMVKKNEYPNIKHPELPTHFGKIDDMVSFDAQFFRVVKLQAASFDPIGRTIMEQAFTAIFDAGINPETLKGTKLGVFIGSSISDIATTRMHNSLNKNSFAVSGCSKAMLANRISYWIDGKGPSYNLDYACASSMACLDMAVQRMQAGDCDAAIVGACINSNNPKMILNMKRAGLLCLDGKTKCFDKSGDGFVRSDAISVFFLQRAKDAKRIYSEIYHVKGKHFSMPDGMFLPTRKPEDIERFLEEFYAEVDVSPKAVEFLEADATGISEADGNELEAVGRFFGQEQPIKVGSVKSNMGHTQPVSGACSLTKICLAYQRGEIPGNLHFSEPQNHLASVKEGKVRVVTENTKFDRSFTAINNFSYTGANFHVLLKGHFKPKNNDLYKSNIPRLVLASGRQDECVNKILDILESGPIDYEQIALLNNIFKNNILGHTGRGFTILDVNEEKNQTVSLARGFEYYSGNVRPVWFMYSGMGSQWVSMGAELMRIPIFAAAIERCDKVLKTKGLDIIKILTENNSEIFDNLLHSFVGITAVQIGLTDVLKSMNIMPDNIIGHSAGEIVCAYADDCFTIEEAIMVSYSRGLASIETKLIKGKMAAIGLGHIEVSKLCPPEIDIACQNSSESTTISGPAEVIEKFVESLSSRGVFARAVASNNIAYHSRYIADAGPKLMTKLKSAIKNPKARSKKWLSTCFSPDQWDHVTCQHASPEYFTHNILNKVYFDDAAKLIPADAIIIEIAPHGLMQAILKRSHTDCLNVPLTRRGDKDNLLYMLKAIGTLYQAGLNPDVDVLYPKVEFPVSTETPVLTHFVGWDHSEKWYNQNVYLEEKFITSSYEFIMSVHDDDYNFIKGFIRNGVNIYPEAAILVLVWETAGMFANVCYKNLSILFNNVKFHDEIKIVSEKNIVLEVKIQRGSNAFEVTHGENLIASGFIEPLTKEEKLSISHKLVLFNDNDSQLDVKDIYKVMSTRGYCYDNNIQSIQSTNIERTKALLKWKNDWILFLDSLIQFNALSTDHDGVSVVKYINKLSIDLSAHEDMKTFIKNNEICHSAQIYKDIGLSKCGGVSLRSIVFTDIPKLEHTAENKLQIRTSIDKDSLGYHYMDSPVVTNTKTQNVKLIHDSNNFTWIEIPPVSSNNTIQIFFAGASLNNDAISMEDKLKINKYGTDFSGMDAAGNRVMGIISDSSISSFVEANTELLWPVPQDWSLEEAATVPLPYIQAYYCLNIKCTLEGNKTVFVSNGDNGFGQAVISICLHSGCTVFTTVSNIEKKKLLLRLFPELEENKIGYSNDVYFKDMINIATKGKRCDLVIDDNQGQNREAAMGCVGYFKTYISVNEYDMEENKYFGMGNIKDCRSYKAICFSNIHLEENSTERNALRMLLTDGIRKGIVRPMTRLVYSPTEISRALKLLASENNRGRVLVNMKHPKVTNDCKTLPRLLLSPTDIYIVVCDGSELGIELIDLLIKRGARRFLIHIKPKLINGYFHLKYASWKKYNVIINFNGTDLHTKQGAEILLTEARKLGNVDGIFITQNDLTDTDSHIIDQDQVDLMTSSIHLASQKFNSIRYFAVLIFTSQELCNEHEFLAIEKCCFLRNELGLPSLVLRHNIQEKQVTTKSLSKLFNAFESSLKQNYTSVLSSDSIENGVKPKGNTFEKGFGAFFNNICEDFCITDPIVYMKTKLQNEDKNEIFLNPEEEYLMIVPGFDGTYQKIKPVTERLKIRALSLQLEPDFDKSITEIANRLMTIVKLRFHLKTKFYILGYSFGVNIALELAALLEKEGKTGVVICLDSSPDALKTQLDAYLGDMNDQSLQNSLIAHIYHLLTGKTSTELNIKLNDTTEWSKKIDLFIDVVKNSVTLTHEFLRSFISAAYRRIEMAKDYEPSYKLESELVLIKGTPHPEATSLADDYGLSKLSKKPVKVFNIEADHVNAPNDCRVSNIVNNMLEPGLLEEFKKKNLCQYYFI